MIGVQLTVLGSGSGGNATLLVDGNTRVLIDVGLSYQDVSRRLAQLGIDSTAIDALVITHAHGDHTKGVRLFSRRHAVPVYATRTIRDEWGTADVAEWRVLTPNRSERVKNLRFYPFRIPHDASETVAFRIETTDGVIGFATDIGATTDELIEQFRDCLVLVVESNHATELLRVSPYDSATRSRIASVQGHLSNESLAVFVRQHLGQSVRCIVLAHLSRVNNVPEIAALTCREALAACGRNDVDVVVSSQDCVAPTVDLGTWTATPASNMRPGHQEVLPF